MCRYKIESKKMRTLSGIKLLKELEIFFGTDIELAIELLKPNQYIRTPDCPGILDTSKLFELFNTKIKEINEKYNTGDNIFKEQMNLDFLDHKYINIIFENGDIEKFIDLEHLQKAKKPLFKDIPISILIDLEISLLEIKESILEYVVCRLVRLSTVYTHFYYVSDKMIGNEMYEKLKNKTNQQLNLDNFKEERLKNIVKVM